ncbi:MAG: toprim domain-containing protein [Candidatus Thorarchaeota archaeon]
MRDKKRIKTSDFAKRIMRGREVDQEIVDSLQSFVKNLNDASNNGALIVVEGKRDIDALKSVGFSGSTFMLCHNNRVVDLVSEAEKYRKIILLLDLDRAGRVLTKKAATILQGKSPIDLLFRRELRSKTKGRVQGIEELKRYKDYLEKPY